MLRSGCVGSTAARRSTVDQLVFFLQPIQFDLQPPDLFVQRRLDRLLVRIDCLPASRKRLGQRRQSPLLPLCDLHRVNADASSLNVRSPRSAATATFALNAALCCRRVAIVGPPRPLAHDLNLADCPDFGVHYMVFHR